MSEQISITSIEKVRGKSYMLHEQTFDPDLPNYKQDIYPELPKHISHIGPTFHFIYDYHDQKYELIEETVQQVLGYSPQVFYQKGIDFVKKRMTPSVSTAFEKMVLRALNHIQYKIPKELQDQYSINFDYQFEHANGKKLHLLQQTLEVVRDRHGSIVFSIEKVTDISHRPPETTPMLSIYGTKPEYSLTYFPRYPGDTKGRTLFSPSELRILQLLDKAYSTQEIALILNLSKNTIATHRKNMLKKAGVSDTLKLLNFARKRAIL